MTGSTSSVTPVFRVSNGVGVVGVTGKDCRGLIADAAGAAAAAAVAVAEGLRNLRRVELGRVTEFADDLDGRLLAALGGHARSGEEVDALALVEGADDELELRIGEDAGERRRQPGRGRRSRATPKSRASMAFWLMARLPLRKPEVMG